MLKAILFDLDDTLIDWGNFSEDWELVERPRLMGVYGYLSQFGKPRGTFEEFVKSFFRHSREAWNNARNTHVAPHLVKILTMATQDMGYAPVQWDVDECLDAYDWQAVPYVKVFPDVPEALALFRHHGLRTGIITNAFQPMKLRDIELEQHGLLQYFPECRYSAADVGYLKPHPSVFNKALAELGILPHEAVFVGDNPSADIGGAQGVGMKAIMRVLEKKRAFAGGLIMPDAEVYSLTEIPSILDDWYPDWRKG
ncbi:MAG TPA: HAD family hydrolase [Aggregatilineales bacterium]|jgi:putative hydrolase of the HAD superfamily|nr:HAD family hydrolase [Aggregatilineales bacterium]